MRISCVLNADQLIDDNPDLIVFPEGISWTEIHKAETTYPRSIIVAAVIEDHRSRGVLWYEGRNQIDYLKIRTDGQTEGTGNIQQDPVRELRELKDMCIGVIICMDVQQTDFVGPIITKIRLSKSKYKFVCIPADMTADWFRGNTISNQYEGVHFILCNHTKTYQSNRCKSFITDTLCQKIRVQEGEEPIHVDLPQNSIGTTEQLDK